MAQGKKTMCLPKHPHLDDNTTGNDKLGNNTLINVHNDNDEATNELQCKWATTSPSTAVAPKTSGQ